MLGGAGEHDAGGQLGDHGGWLGGAVVQVRWGTAGQIVTAWLTTIPVSAAWRLGWRWC